MATLRFTALSPGTHSLTVDAQSGLVDVVANPIDVAFTGALLTVGPPTPSPTPTRTSTPTQTPTPTFCQANPAPPPVPVGELAVNGGMYC